MFVWIQLAKQASKKSVKQMDFVDKPTYEKLIRKENGKYYYNLTPEIIGEFNHIPEIRKEIDSLI